MPRACGPWVAVSEAALEERPAALTSYVTGWAASWGLDDPPRTVPAFCFDVVPLVVALQIDDAEARTATPAYPGDLVDHAKSL